MDLKEWLDRMPGDLDADNRLWLLATALDVYRKELSVAVNSVTEVVGRGDLSIDRLEYLMEIAEPMAADIRSLAREGLSDPEDD